MGSETSAITIAELKAEIERKALKLEEQKEKEQERKYENLDEEVKDMRKRLISELFDRTDKQNMRILELEIARREDKDESKKSNMQLAGGGVSIVALVQVIQYFLTSGASG